MVDVIKDLFKKYSLPIPILYISIIIFYTSLFSYEHNTYVVDFLTTKLFNSYENLCFVNIYVKNLIIFLIRLYAFLFVIATFANNSQWKIILIRFEFLIMFLSAFKLFVYILINYKRSPDENISIILKSLGITALPILIVIIICGLIDWKKSKN